MSYLGSCVDNLTALQRENLYEEVSRSMGHRNCSWGWISRRFSCCCMGRRRLDLALFASKTGSFAAGLFLFLDPHSLTRME